MCKPRAAENARFFRGFIVTITYSWLTNQSARIDLVIRQSFVFHSILRFFSGQFLDSPSNKLGEAQVRQNIKKDNCIYRLFPTSRRQTENSWSFSLAFLEEKEIKWFCYTSQLKYVFPRGGDRLTCLGLNLTNSLGRTKLNNSLGKQQHELLTRTWSGRAPWNRGKFVSQPA